MIYLDVAWINPTDQNQLTWAINYLRKKGVPYRQDSHGQILIPPHPHELVNKKLISDMKSAWRQRKLRDSRKGKTEFSLVISKEKKQTLKRIASNRKKTLGETLEELIAEERDKDSRYREVIKREKAEIRERLNEQSDAIDLLLSMLKTEILNRVKSDVKLLELQSPTASTHSGTEPVADQEYRRACSKINKEMRLHPALKNKLFSMHQLKISEDRNEVQDVNEWIPKW